MKMSRVGLVAGCFLPALFLCLPAHAQQGISIHSVDPRRHFSEGGTEISIYGMGFGPNLIVSIGKLPLLEATVVSPVKITGKVPKSAPGTYDVLASVPGTPMAITLPQAVEYIAETLPAVEDFSCIRLAGEVQLSWSNLVRYDSLRVVRSMGVGAAAATFTLAGDATRFADVFSNGIPDGQPLRYTVTGSNGRILADAAACDAVPIVCPPQLIWPGKLRMGPVRIPLHGQDMNEAQTFFKLDDAAPEGVRIRVHAARTRAFGELKARLRKIALPHDLLIDGIEMQDLAISASGSWSEGVTLAPLASGEYVVGFYVDGGSAGTTHYSISTDESEEDLGAPYPCPPLALAKVYALGGNIPPQILRIDELPVFRGSFDLFIEAPLAGGGAIGEETTVRLRASAQDPDGFVIRYQWDFGDGTPAESASAAVTHTFPAYGTYEVRLTVTDNGCARDSEVVAVRVKPSVSPPPAGSPPKITHISPDPDELTFIPDIDPNVSGTYSVLVTPAATATVASVQMSLLHPTTPQVLLQRAAVKAIPSDPDPQTFWKASLNMSDLPDLPSCRLQIVARDSQGFASTETFIQPLCPKPGFFDLSYVDSTISYDSDRREYKVTTTLPDEPLYESEFNVPVVGSLHNLLDARLTASVRLRNHRWYPDKLYGELAAELLNIDLHSKSFDLANSSDSAFFNCPDFSFQYEKDNVSIFNDEWKKEVFNKTLYDGWVGPVKVRVKGSLDVGLKAIIKADVYVLIRQTSPYVDVDVLVKPTLEGWAEGAIKVDVFWGIASATVSLLPTIILALPTHLQSSGLSISADVDACFRLKLDVKVKACVNYLLDTECWTSDPIHIFDVKYPNGCTAAGGGQADGAEVEDRGAGDLAAGGGLPTIPEPPDIKSPSVAISPDGSRSLMVFVKNIDTAGGYNPELYHSLDTGAGWSIPAPMKTPADQIFQRDPHVAFISNTKAIAVWTQSRLTRDEVRALPNSTGEPGDVDFANATFQNDEIQFAFWTLAGGWTMPQRLTDDLFPDGMAKVAPDTGQDAAWVTWVRSENQSMIDAEGNAILSGMGIYARKIEGTAAVGGLIKVSSDDGAGGAADLEAAIASSPTGSGKIILWVRDGDADFDTPEDRFIAYSVFAGGSWGPVQAYGDPTELPGILMPSLALSSDDDGVLAFTAREVNEDGEVAGEGTKDIVYTALLVDGVFGPATPVQRRACKKGGDTFGRWPIVQFIDAKNAVLAFQSFDGFGSEGGDGELAVATIDTGLIDVVRGGPRWTLVRELTEDKNRDWEIALAARAGRIRTVRDSAAGGADWSGLVPTDVAWAPDLAIDQVRLSDPHAPPGGEVGLTIVLRNAGLRGLSAPGRLPNTTLRIGKIMKNQFIELAALPHRFYLPPDGIQEVAHTLAVPAGTLQIVVIADKIAEEVETANNRAEVTLGVLAPRDLECVDVAEGASLGVGLRWKNAEPYEEVLVYRNGRLRAVLAGDAEVHVDSPLGTGEHVFAVRGRIGETLSDPAGAACRKIVQPPARFLRGNSNGDGAIDITDPIITLDYLFQGGGNPSCLDAVDSNDDGTIDVTDPIYTLDHLFRGGRTFPAPHPLCGWDPSPDRLGCESYGGSCIGPAR